MTTSHLARYAPYFLGAQNFFEEIENLAHRGTSYPPYNLIEFSDNKYQVDFALAGFSKDELSVTQEKGYLVVEGNKKDSENDEILTYLHKGISSREFTNRFKLSENVNVISADFTNGILSVTLEKIIPDSEKPKSFSIK